MKLTRNHLIGLYFTTAAIGAIFTIMWLNGSLTVVRIIQNSPQIAIIPTAVNLQWLRFLTIFAGNLLVACLAALALVWMNKPKITISALLLSISFNGFLLGTIGGYAALAYGLLYIIAGLVPHGIFELTAIFTAWGLSLTGIQRIKSHQLMKAVLIDNLRSVVSFCVPLLLMAAIIETFITPLIIEVVA